MSTRNSDRPQGNGIRVALAALTGLIAGAARAAFTWLFNHLDS
ncbi:hypothetical protein [Verrucosispora sp. WMMD1129]|nr:hypothetical protein [Verrucosispora sp. WMMD1129]WFE47572.1 hypothetical protein O7624_26250 [Verrucosispora sp. WMMD1129]